MFAGESEFLNAVLLRASPKKVLEIGVSSGASTVVLANALKETDGKLYSIDLSKTYYRDRSKPCGFIMEEYPELQNNRKQYLGGMACTFMDEIGDGIDFAFIDTAHVFPGELLDFLMVYPYLLSDATVVFHDTCLNLAVGLDPFFERFFVTGTACSAITGEKLQPLIDYANNSTFPSPNITAIKLTPETGQRLWEVFNLLVHTWEYPLSEEHLAQITGHFEKWYPKEAVEFFKRVNEFQNHHFARRHRFSQPQGAAVPPHKVTKFHYNKYRLLATLTFGNLRKKYNAKRKAVKAALHTHTTGRNISFLKECGNDDYDKLDVAFPEDNLQKAKMLVDFANTLQGYTRDTWKNPGMILIEEKRLLYLLAKHYFAGEGDVFDAGIFVGGCTEAFSSGLMKNPNLGKINKHIWAYELAKNNPPNCFYTQTLKSYYGETVDISSGDFGDLVRKNIAHLEGAEKIKLFIGDIMEQEYPDKIEIMFLDVCKSPQLNFAMQKLYSRMMPGKSLLIHQDYVFGGVPWIRITMGYLAEYFEYVGSTPLNSAVWLLKKEIPREVLDVDPYNASFNFRELVKLHNHWNHVFDANQQACIMGTFGGW
jgi:predicted O-methyltransferase YrrM